MNTNTKEINTPVNYPASLQYEPEITEIQKPEESFVEEFGRFQP